MAPIGPRDLARVLRTTFASNETTYPDLSPPVELLELVDSFVSNAVPSATLSETLLETSFTVARGKERGDTVGRVSAWLVVLARLCNDDVEVLTRSTVGQQLWQPLLKRALMESSVVLHREAVAAAKALLLYAFEVAEREEECLTPLEEEVLAEYLDATAFVEGESDARSRRTRDRERGANHLEDVLLAMGRQRAKAFFSHLSRWLAVKIGQRSAILRLVNDFCRSYPAQAFHALPTKLFDNLMNALLIDEDVHIVQLALSAILLILPRIPSSLEALLPGLLAAYARCLALVDLGKTKAQLQAEHTSPASLSPTPQLLLRSDLIWQRPPASEPSQRATADEHLPLLLVQDLFAFLYAFTPCNTIAFLRTPLEYLAEKEWPSPYADGPAKCFDKNLLRDRAELVLCTQTVHPTLVYSNAIAELAELPRLSKIEAADILLVVQRYSSPAQLPRDDIAASGAATPVRTLSPPATEAYAAIRAIASPPGSEFLHSPSSASSSSRPRASSETTTKLERDLALLRAELAYELMLKQQHTDRLGALHRERINKASADAERQALNDSLKIHKAAASEAREDLATERRDNAKIKAGSKSRLARLTGKLEVLGRKEVEWAKKEKADEVKIASMQATITAQAEELEAIGKRLFDLESQAKVDAPKLEEREQMDARIRRLTQFLLAWDDDMSRAKAQRKQIEEIVSDWQKAVQLRDIDAQQIADLSKALRESEHRTARVQPKHPPANATRTSERTSPSQRADSILREQYTELRRKARVLEEELVELRAASAAVP